MEEAIKNPDNNISVFILRKKNNTSPTFAKALFLLQNKGIKTLYSIYPDGTYSMFQKKSDTQNDTDKIRSMYSDFYNAAVRKAFDENTIFSSSELASEYRTACFYAWKNFCKKQDNYGAQECENSNHRVEYNLNHGDRDIIAKIFTNFGLSTQMSSI